MHGNAYINLWLHWKIFQQQAHVPAEIIESLHRALSALALESQDKNVNA